MEKANEGFKSFRRNTSDIFKFLLTISLTALYLKLILSKAPDTLTNPANMLLFFIVSLYIFAQAFNSYLQIKDIRYNYILLKYYLQHPLSDNNTFLKNLRLAFISTFDSLAEKCEDKILADEIDEDEVNVATPEAQVQLILIAAHKKLLLQYYRETIHFWPRRQAFYQAQLQKAIDLDISFIETHREIIYDLGEQIIEQRKQLIAWHKKNQWPKPNFKTFIACLYRPIPTEVTGSKLMKQSFMRLNSKDFWQEYLDMSIPINIFVELHVYLRLVPRIRDIINEDTEPLPQSASC